MLFIGLNGANLTNPQTGHYNLDLPINLSDIERIEIIQGPASFLYGAGAFSGGINIVTKKIPARGFPPVGARLCLAQAILTG